MDTKPEVIHSTEYVSERVRRSALLSNEIESKFLRRAQNVLQNEPFHMKDKFLGVAAVDVIVQGKRIFENVEQCDQTPAMIAKRREEQVKLYRMSDRYRTLLDEAVLMIKLCNHDDSQMGVEQCDARPHQQQQQLLTYQRLFPSIAHACPTVTVTTMDVTDFAVMMQSIKTFMSQTAVKSKRGLIVFLGALENDQIPVTQCQSKPFEIVVDCIGSCFAECSEEQLLPAEIDVVYQQTLSDIGGGRDVTSVTPCVHALNMSNTISKGFVLKHFNIELDTDNVFHQSTKPPEFHAATASSRTNPMFTTRQFMPLRQPASSSDVQAIGQDVKPATRTWSSEDVVGYDTVDSQ